jgi:hypothetical protein
VSKKQYDTVYMDLLLNPIRAIKDYVPKLGQNAGVSLNEFTTLYGSDPLYHWVGFDNPLMYAAHKASGAMTSLYRNLGTGCEHLFKQVLMDQLGLSEEDIKWSYVTTNKEVESFEGSVLPVFDPGRIEEIAGVAEDIPDNGLTKGKGKKNTLDGRFDLASIKAKQRHEAAAKWLERLRLDRDVTWDPLGAVFEVRQGYKSMDSKRQAADIANATQALSRQHMPVLVVMSSQIDDVLVTRYKASGWGLLRGFRNEQDSLVGTFAFFDEVLGYDLVAFFERNQDTLRGEVAEVLSTLLGESK